MPGPNSRSNGQRRHFERHTYAPDLFRASRRNHRRISERYGRLGSRFCNRPRWRYPPKTRGRKRKREMLLSLLRLRLSSHFCCDIFLSSHGKDCIALSSQIWVYRHYVANKAIDAGTIILPDSIQSVSYPPQVAGKRQRRPAGNLKFIAVSLQLVILCFIRFHVQPLQPSAFKTVGHHNRKCRL